MRKYVLFLFCSLLSICAIAQEKWDDETLQKQFQAMELGEIDFTPKEYYRILHGKPDLLNLWLGDNYAVYDHKWQWSGIHSGWTWKFNADKSKAKNVYPSRILYTASDSLTTRLSEEMMDTLLHQVNRELGRAVDCTVDLYYDAYKDLFNAYDKSITENLSIYLVESGKMVNGTLVTGDIMGIKDKTILELNKIRQMIDNTHNAYLESTQKEELYSTLLQDYKKLNRIVYLNMKIVQ